MDLRNLYCLDYVGCVVIFGSLCSGIEAASVAFKSIGWKAGFFSEIEKFPNQVLEHHYSGVLNFGDMTKFNEWKNHEPIRLLCGGTPCQSFSIAGMRKGLDDSRGNLMLTFGEMAAKLRPQWILWENVPGVLSSAKGKDFGAFLGLISGREIPVPDGGWGKAGIIPGYRNAYGLAYRVFDAQYFGVAQRRRRVFVVGYLGDWRPAAAVLFERESLCGYPAPSRKTGEKIAPCVTNGPPFSRTGNERVEAEAMVVAQSPETFRWQNDQSGIVQDEVSATLRRESATTDERSVPAYVVPMAFSAKDYGGDATHDLSPTLRAGNSDKSHANSGNWMAVSFAQNQIGEVRTGAVAGTLNTNSNASGRNTPMAMSGMAVRRLTPTECERLQGFEDGYTNVPDAKGKPAADGARYKALGNSWAVPNVAWIGRRIDFIEKLLEERK